MCRKALVVLILVPVFSVMVKTMPSETTTSRSPTSQIGETIKQLTSQLMDANSTSDVITLDTRTPPKVKEHAKKKQKPQIVENSHAGIAIPMEPEAVMEESTKKMHFYKIERPTTTSGLSTWILLNHQTTKKPKKDEKNVTTILVPEKVIKPIFKKRITTTTKKPATTETTTKTTKLTKIKASILNNALKKNTTITPEPLNTTKIIKTTIKPLEIKNVTTTEKPTSLAPAEAKEGELDLNLDKKRRKSNKRKKNKNRRRRPAEKTQTNITKLEKPQRKDKPIGAQLYNYLSREIMPTVGVGLVGLMVTAGLASYFLYPFGITRRSYEIDRKDKEGSYYYSDEYSGGIAEEEAIGKVIAGMPINTFNNNYKTPTSRLVNRQVEYFTTSPPVKNYPSYNPKNEIIEKNRETGYTVDGNTYNVAVTPAVVPEHGPRNLRIRKRDLSVEQTPSNLPDNKENEISFFDSSTESGTASTTTIKSTTTTRTTTIQPDKVKTFFDLIRDLIHLKINLGLQIVHNATLSISKYISKVQTRLDQHYRNSTKNRH